MPVVDPGSSEIVGIVTRTDLINLWHLTREEQPVQVNLTNQLEQSLSLRLLQLLHEAGTAGSQSWRIDALQLGR